MRDDIITASLEGLHKVPLHSIKLKFIYFEFFFVLQAASLSNTLKLQARSSSILALLSASSCKTNSSKLLASHALSLDVLLSKGNKW